MNTAELRLAYELRDQIITRTTDNHTHSPTGLSKSMDPCQVRYWRKLPNISSLYTPIMLIPPVLLSINYHPEDEFAVHSEPWALARLTLQSKSCPALVTGFIGLVIFFGKNPRHQIMAGETNLWEDPLHGHPRNLRYQNIPTDWEYEAFKELIQRSNNWI